MRDDDLSPVAVAWLRQLAIGLSLHRLYSGQQVDAAIEAADRIIAAATEALTAGRVELEVHAGAFVGAPADGSMSRLAAACFERRIEHLALVDVPTGLELSVLFTVLSEDPADLELTGGAPARLAAGGVRSMVASDAVPDVDQGAASDALAVVVDGELDPGDDDVEEVWRPYAGADAEGFEAHLRGLAAHHPAEVLARTSFHRRAMDHASRLEPEERARFERRLLGRLHDDDLAAHLLGHLSDIGLADLVGRVSRAQSVDPRELAVEVARRLDRSDDLPRLTLERLLASNIADSETDVRPSPVQDPAVDHPLARGFPDDEAEGRELANRALVDVLAIGIRAEHLEPLVDAVGEQIRADLARGDVAGVTGLLEAWRQGRDLAAPEPRIPPLTAAVLDEDTVLAVLGHGSGTAARLLDPLAREAIPHLIAALEPERPEAVRYAAGAVLEPMLLEHREAVAAALGPRSVPVRLALLDLLGRVDDRAAVPLLARLAEHRDPTLLIRVIEALERTDPAAATPILGAIVSRTEDRAVQRRGLEALAARPAPAARELLSRLGDRASSPLPRSSRRLARTLAERRR